MIAGTTQMILDWLVTLDPFDFLALCFVIAVGAATIMFILMLET